MISLIKLPNIGVSVEEKLLRCKIKTPKQLKKLGSKKALEKIARLGRENISLTLLYALEGAIQNIRWHYLSEEVKQELKEFYVTKFKG